MFAYGEKNRQTSFTTYQYKLTLPKCVHYTKDKLCQPFSLLLLWKTLKIHGGIPTEFNWVEETRINACYCNVYITSYCFLNHIQLRFTNNILWISTKDRKNSDYRVTSQYNVMKIQITLIEITLKLLHRPLGKLAVRSLHTSRRGCDSRRDARMKNVTGWGIWISRKISSVDLS